AWRAEDSTLANDWWALLETQHADFTLAFRYLASAFQDPGPWLDLFQDPAAAQVWLDRYEARLAGDAGDAGARRRAMDAVNPLYVLRNHLAQEVIMAAQQGDVLPLERLFGILQAPYEPHHDGEPFALPPQADTPVVAVSCSS